MEEILTLLQQKHDFLGQFYDLNEVELENFKQQKFENLESFYQTRDQLLGSIQKVDDLIAQAQTQELHPTAEFRRHFNELIAAKNELVKNILVQDLQILSAIETAKSEIIRELQTVRNNRRGIGRYKSPNVIARLDEEL